MDLVVQGTKALAVIPENKITVFIKGETHLVGFDKNSGLPMLIGEKGEVHPVVYNAQKKDVEVLDSRGKSLAVLPQNTALMVMEQQKKILDRRASGIDEFADQTEGLYYKRKERREKGRVEEGDYQAFFRRADRNERKKQGDADTSNFFNTFDKREKKKSEDADTSDFFSMTDEEKKQRPETGKYGEWNNTEYVQTVGPFRKLARKIRIPIKEPGPTVIKVQDFGSTASKAALKKEEVKKKEKKASGSGIKFSAGDMDPELLKNIILILLALAVLAAIFSVF
jgi:hypothetical protein